MTILALTRTAADDVDIFHAAVQLSPIPMVLVDPHRPDQPIIFCNRAFCLLTGYEEHEALGRNCRFLQGKLSDPVGMTQLRDAIAARVDVQVEIWNYRKDGSAFWNSMFIGPVFDPSGTLLFFLGSQIDATARRDAEEASRRAARMDTLGSMAAGIAHEFANLMTVAMGSIESVAREPLTQRQSERLEQAAWATRGAGRLTQQMLSFAQRQSVEADLVDLNGVIGNIDRVLTQLAGPGMDFEIALADEPLPASIDVGQLELALINLVRNAADASGGRGRICISTRDAGPRADDRPDRGWVEVAVADRGSGMPAELLTRVTEPFFTTKAKGKGTGLGLSMVQGFVQQAGGTLRIASTEGQGTTIRLMFPRAAAAP